MSYDLVIRGGDVVLPGAGVTACDLAVSDGRIAAIGAGFDGGEVVDARGLVVMPGAIDAHVHFGMGSPEDWTTESRAAARGGVTAVLNYEMDARSYLEVGPEALQPMLAKGRAQGIECRGPSDHGMIDSIYFRDPNGYVIELCAKRADHDAQMDPESNDARAMLQRWSQAKSGMPA